MLIRNPAMPSDQPSNMQSVNTGLKFESYDTGSDTQMWQGLQTIMDYKGKHSYELPSDTSLPDKLNYFYGRFEANNTEAGMRASSVPGNCVITLSVADVSKTYQGQTDYQDVYSEHVLTNWQVYFQPVPD